MNSPPRVQRGHVRRPGHSPQRTVSDDRRRGKHDEDCSDSNCDGGVGLRRGCDRRMRSSSLARSRDVPCSGRRKRQFVLWLIPAGRQRGRSTCNLPLFCCSAGSSLLGVYFVAMVPTISSLLFFVARACSLQAPRRPGQPTPFRGLWQDSTPCPATSPARSTPVFRHSVAETTWVVAQAQQQ